MFDGLQHEIEAKFDLRIMDVVSKLSSEREDRARTQEDLRAQLQLKERTNEVVQ